MKFCEFEGGGVVEGVFRPDFEGGVVDEVLWIRGGGGSWRSFPAQFRGGVVDEVPWSSAHFLGGNAKSFGGNAIVFLAGTLIALAGTLFFLEGTLKALGGTAFPRVPTHFNHCFQVAYYIEIPNVGKDPVCQEQNKAGTIQSKSCLIQSSGLSRVLYISPKITWRGPMR